MTNLKLDDVLKRRILGGEQVTVEENGKFFVPYSSIFIEAINGAITINFINGTNNIAWFKSRPGESLTITGIDGRLEAST